jgi:hypothetical protein
MSAETLDLQSDFVKEMQTDLDQISPEHGRFSIRYWQDSYVIEFTPLRSTETMSWQTYSMSSLLNKVRQLIEEPENASSLLHQPRPMDPDGSSDDLR